VPVTTLLIVWLLLVVAIETVVRRRRDRSGWGAFSGWVLAGFLSGFATISFAIGLLVLPFAAIAIVVVSRFGVWPAFLGFAGGAGLVGVLVSVLNFGEPSGPDYYS
jgi:CBS-domain-containing membrane protein